MKKALEIVSNALIMAMALLFILSACAIDSDSYIPFIGLLISLAYFSVLAMFYRFKNLKIRRKRG